MTTSTPKLFARLRHELAERLPEKRFLHVLGVEGLTTSLALRHGVNPEKAILSALLHDYFKAVPKSELSVMMNDVKHPITPRPEDWDHPQIWHGLIAAQWAWSTLSVTDSEVLEAVYFHTTGRRNLSPVGLVLYIADCLEPSRDYRDVVELRKKILDLPLHHAAYEVSKIKLLKLERKATNIHPDTVEMRDWLAEIITSRHDALEQES